MLSSIFAALFLAAIPVEWSVDTFRVKPFVYDCYHGETLDLAASMTAYGTPLNLAGKTAKLYWATNANATAWWTTNATVAASGSLTNILAATFSGSYDTGADMTYGFIGVDGENYRAAFTLRFRPSPGFTPNGLNPPVTVLDFAATTVLNPESSPFIVKGGEGGVTLSQVTNIAQNVTSNIVPAWARAETPPESMTDNAVVLTNDILRTKGGTAIDYTTTNAVRSLIASPTVTNAGAVATAKAYADGKFVPSENGSGDGKFGWGTYCLNIGYKGSGTEDMISLASIWGNESYFRTPVWFKSTGEYKPAVTVSSWNEIGVYDESTYQSTRLPAYIDSLSWRTTGNRSLSSYGITNAIPSVDFTTNNTVLVSTITNVAGKAGGGTASGIDLHDAGLGCDWQLSVSNSVFTWTVKED